MHLLRRLLLKVPSFIIPIFFEAVRDESTVKEVRCPYH